MKTRLAIGLGFAMGMCGAAWADGALDPTALGSIDAMVAACTQVNPGGSATYENLRAIVIGEQSETDVKAATQTPEYRDAYEAAHQKSEAEEHDAMVKQCATLGTSMGPRVHQRPQPRTAAKPVAKPAAKSGAVAKPAPKPAEH